MSRKDKTIACLDIGTTKICMLIARVTPDNGLELVSSGYADSAGLRKGIVVDLDEAAASIRKAADEAEMKSGESVDWVTVGIAGDHVQSFNCHGAVSIEGKHRSVTGEHVSQVIQAAQSIPIPPEREIIHVLPQEFFLDNRGGIRNPVGLTGSRLDVNIHVVTCESALCQNLISAVNRADMRVRKPVLQQLGSAEAVLDRHERDLGVAVIDIGGGTTDIVVFARSAIRFTSVLPLGGFHFTRDLAIGLRTPVEDAERIKKESGSVQLGDIAEDERVQAPSVGSRDFREHSRRFACSILRDRAVEALELVKEQLERSGEIEHLVAGAVLTGGGSMIDGILELGEEILEMPVRQGVPLDLPGLTEELGHPVYSTAIGLAMLVAEEDGDRLRRPGTLNRFLAWVGS